jgi:lipoprotein-anchoring transpeptidase ErfK/SrfK
LGENPRSRQLGLGCVRMLKDHVRQLFDLFDVGASLENWG